MIAVPGTSLALERSGFYDRQIGSTGVFLDEDEIASRIGVVRRHRAVDEVSVSGRPNVVAPSGLLRKLR